MWLHKLFKRSDWIPIWNHRGTWDVERFDAITNRKLGNYETYAIYTIFYSKRKNAYKLKVSGYNPRQHTEYAIVCKKMAELNGIKV